MTLRGNLDRVLMIGKMKQWLVLSAFLVTPFCLQAQEVQWASEVLDFSSEYQDVEEPKSFRAVQALGRPNKLPQFGESALAWGPSKTKNPEGEYLVLGGYSMKGVRQVVVAENNNPGSVSRIVLYDEKGTAHVVYENAKPTAPTGKDEKGRMFHAFFSPTSYTVKSVRIEMSTPAIEGFNEIDAVGISTSKTPVQAEINVPADLTLPSKPENLGPMVNSPYGEVTPVIAPDGRLLFFTRDEHPGNIGAAEEEDPEDITQDIWFSRILPDGSFSEAERLPEPVNNDGNNYVCSVSPDGNTLLIGNKYLPDGTMKKGVSITKRTSGGWSKPVGLEIEDFYNDSQYGEYSLHASEKILLMAIERKDTQGKKDMYVCFRKRDGTWTVPKNMGPLVNSALDETSPFLAPDGVTLYYSSAGFSGYGKNDMMVTRRLDETWTNWSEPQNLGPELNTSGWDAYYTIPASGEYAYYVSWGNSYGKADIFRVPLPESVKPKPVFLVSGRVLDLDTKEPIEATINYIDFESEEPLGYAHSTPGTGEYKIILPLGAHYGFLAEADGYISVHESIDLRDKGSYIEVTRDLYMARLKVGQKVRLNNVLFKPGSAYLQTESYNELQKLRDLLDGNPTLRIEVSGHTESRGSRSANIKLSKERAEVVKDYLVDELGVDAKRIKTAGYGPDQPVASNDTYDGRALNRRVEIKVLGL